MQFTFKSNGQKSTEFQKFIALLEVCWTLHPKKPQFCTYNPFAQTVIISGIQHGSDNW